ncbi:hypothetical protein DIURU_003004 [Diutina rugosa]|uniref:chitin synthase n=1 Tax=Diutina rugosa TaxID=5481 RepID=A0A642USR4_DIURU|nr:uncharacterized protein DIURU_003004 [Diutina rugosa]KAA8902210.1 hypothetical protein DIURU_003004 [Diutina rugosa]
MTGFTEFDPESGDIQRHRSLVRHDRQRLDESYPYYHYAQVANQESGHIRVQPSSTGVNPQLEDMEPLRSPDNRMSEIDEESDGAPLMDMHPATDDLKGGREVYGLNDEMENNNEKIGHQPFKANHVHLPPTRKQQQVKQAAVKEAKHDIYFWKVYCYVITFWAPAPLLNLFGIRGKDRQFAWREKMGLISCILYIGAFVAYLTFGFTQTVCYNNKVKIRNNEVAPEYLIINGRAYDLSRSTHPAAAGVPDSSNVLYPPVNAGGMDASFLFQNVNGNCKGLITPRDNTTIPHDGDDLAWYMPCRLFNQDGSSEVNSSFVYYDGWACHTSDEARQTYYGLTQPNDVYFTWDDIKNSSRNLIVYSGNVLDLDLINWILRDEVHYPKFFDELRDDPTYRGIDVSVVLNNAEQRKMGRCLTEIVKVGTIDSDTIGCIASQVVLIVSLVFILSVVVVKFLFACYYRWWLSRKQGATEIDNKSMAKRNIEIDKWVDEDANPAVLAKTVPPKARANYSEKTTNRQSVFKRFNDPTRLSRSELSQYFDSPEAMSKHFKYTTMATQKALLGRRQKRSGANRSARNSTLYLNDHFDSSTDLLTQGQNPSRPGSTYFGAGFDMSDEYVTGLPADLISPMVVPQPPVEYQPFGYPLAHTINLVTCYSEDEAGLRTTLDSIATTDYPNSHKLILVVCDGIIKGSGNDQTTPEIALGMMDNFVVEPEDVQPYSYVAVASGAKRHNMAKIYGGFYKYDDATVPPEKQQRVPIVTVVKCGTPAEATTPKPGNRGKRDSQIILMNFLQKVMFDERMTEMEYSLLLTIWQLTGLMAEMYEITLMVDADTKVYPDSLTHMCAEMIKDPEIMGLCGETKISNKNASWVTLIQVFEYYISHHQAKAFESVFGGVTCLPGCFCMYRIKAPKGHDGYWVPILANPDIVERYSDNVLNTLHRKNLLLLGEDRYLSSLMLRTFPKRKQVFVSKAACKTIVPDEFKVLLSQRRRWINSTVHNLMELVLVNDLCGTFCFSMQFVVFIELVGTLVLPAAICFTIYVIIIAIVSKPTPILSLVLLGVIFGLPGLLIVITVSSLKYIIYFFIYLFALPIWNFVLPAYAYWKFDDFSWGETRVVQGGDKGDHSNADGQFDGNDIVMKRWREFERMRRHSEQQQRGESGLLQVPMAAWDPSTNTESSG